MCIIKFDDEHEKVVAIAIAGLLVVAVAAILAAVWSAKFVGFDNITNTSIINATATTTSATTNAATAAALITLAGTAVGGVAGFISHKTNGKNGNGAGKGSCSLVLKVPELPDPKPKSTVNFSLNAVNPNDYPLTYSMFPSTIPDTKLDSKTGAFCWNTPEVTNTTSYTMTFIVTDDHGNSDSKDITFVIKP